MHYFGESFIVLTGGPGAEKTTLLDALSQAGFATAGEVGRAVIKDQMRVMGRALPWIDPPLYAEVMMSWEMRSYRLHAAQGGLRFFDRGIPDVIGYLRLCGLPVPEHMHRATEAFRYGNRVFLLPPWPEIFKQDHERKQTIEEARRTYEAMAETYAELGYELVEVPRLSVGERMEFVVEAASGR
jgi:predicted ATPase